MKTGYRGTFVLSWMQTEIDAFVGAPVGAIEIGSTWRWTGRALRIDAPRDILVLEGAEEIEELHRRAAQSIGRLTGSALARANVRGRPDADDRLFEAGFDVTDGRRQYRVTLIPVDRSPLPLVLFLGDVPPSDTDLWVLSVAMAPFEDRAGAGGAGETICFTPGTMIATGDGPRPVEDLQEGDRIRTRDSGDQPLLWVGRRPISGARLRAIPQLRPVRLRANVLGQEQPDADLVVSPDHRILIRGSLAAALFNSDEVLVAARDLVNDATITVDHQCRDVTYIHLMLPAHHIIWANGIETESFNPSLAALDGIAPDQRRRLYGCMPELKDDLTVYGMPARRTLSRSDAALMRYEMA